MKLRNNWGQMMIFHSRKTSAVLFTIGFSLFLLPPFFPIHEMHHRMLYEMWFLRIIGTPVFFFAIYTFWCFSIKVDEKGIYSLYAWGDRELKVTNFMEWNEIGRVRKSSQRFCVYRKSPVKANIWIGPNKNLILFSTFFDYMNILQWIRERSESALIDPEILATFDIQPRTSLEAQAVDRFKENDSVNRKYWAIVISISLVMILGGGFIIYEGIEKGLPYLAVIGMMTLFLGFVAWMVVPVFIVKR